jgi:DNA modification methylase
LTLTDGTPLVSAKRGPNERKGVHSWHPYYAGYSEAFVRSALGFLYCDESTIVLDPWGGSGTTSLIAAHEGIPSISLDINPVMATFAASKSSAVLKAEDAICTFLKSTFSEISDFEINEADPLLSMFDGETAAYVRHYLDHIPFPAAVEKMSSHFAVRLEPVLKDTSLVVGPVYSFCKAAMFVALRVLCDPKKHANPTWMSQGSEKLSFSAGGLRDAVFATAQKMLKDLRLYYAGVSSDTPSWCLAADARKLPFQNNSIDRVITSPPYLTRIDYAVSTAPELMLFGNDSLVEHVRHNTMGAPVVTRNVKVQKPEWGPLCNEFLSSVASHSTKAAKTYYWKNLAQYFMDMEASLTEIFRVMKPGGSGIIVVQSSYFKEIEAKLGEMYVEMATNLGFVSSLVFREKVVGHMAHVNTRSNVYKTNKIYHEDCVFIRKPQE